MNFLYLTILFIGFYTSNINSHNAINGGCNSHCFTEENYHKKNDINPTDELNDFIEQSSCINSSLCRG